MKMKIFASILFFFEEKLIWRHFSPFLKENFTITIVILSQKTDFVTQIWKPDRLCADLSKGQVYFLGAQAKRGASNSLILQEEGA